MRQSSFAEKLRFILCELLKERGVDQFEIPARKSLPISVFLGRIKTEDLVPI